LFSFTVHRENLWSISFKICFSAQVVVSIFLKELVYAFSCAYIELWMHLGSLESTQEAIASSNSSLTLTLLSCSPNIPRASITRYTHAKYEPILKRSLRTGSPQGRKKIRRAKRESASETALALVYIRTWLVLPKPNREPVRRLLLLQLY